MPPAYAQERLSSSNPYSHSPLQQQPETREPPPAWGHEDDVEDAANGNWDVGKKDVIEWGVIGGDKEAEGMKDKTGLGMGWGRTKGPKVLQSVWREWTEAEEFRTRFEVLTAEEVERREVEKERASRLPALIKALINPVEEVPNTIQLLSATTFVSEVDSATRAKTCATANHLDVVNVAWLENYLVSLKTCTSIIV
ncbi:hypothetical protein DEU56DRAFT_754563 [Suillus clintonianus]|uniref:uncharacterized protein n=1 Tax=Suillus clintonianus TaxID=1904413 RepID=UPI001B87C025|nr:uncharacterized protein DEU56DRAFT_754563 [Suillus clintonianus]KAG2142970.1 hypothetical protein DEU56DRAFT_754563 [Suillus clintonianus]